MESSTLLTINMSFIATTWNNGQYHTSGAGYGIKISLENRERFFNPDWQTVILHLNSYDHPVQVNVAKESFWNRTCGELISKHIGLWLQRNNCARWPIRQPNQVRMTVIGQREFKVELI
jgi:hypothetical protein